MSKQTVAVIGAGPAGLAVTKNLLEAGDFDITIFERRGEVGGVWSHSKDPKVTSTLKTTLSNVSKFGNSFTDFPISDEMPSHLTAAQTFDYIKSYAKHFELEQYVRFNTNVKWIERNAENTKWQVCVNDIITEGGEVRDFDKVVVCSGLYERAITPKIEGIEKFTGTSLHVQAFKRPEEFTGQRVLVLGIGNSAADTSTGLVSHASKIYLSHRGGVKIVPRMVDGAPLDLVISRQLNLMKFALDKYSPWLSKWLFDYVFEGVTKKAFPNLDPAWRLSPAPSLANHQPVISDTLVNNLRENKITSVYGIKRFLGEKELELEDGTKLEVDTVIWTTGYESNFSIFRDYDPFAPVSAVSTTNIKAKQTMAPDELRLASLYQNIFPPNYASSLAFMNYAALTDGAMTLVDVVAMAIAQIWKPSNPYALPSPTEMAQHIADHHTWVRSLTRNGTESVYAGVVRPGNFYRFLNEAAGTGLDDYLRFTIKGFKLWLKDRKLYQLMMWGVMTPYMYRIFDVEGREGRKTWDGARDAILHANELAKIYKS